MIPQITSDGSPTLRPRQRGGNGRIDPEWAQEELRAGKG